ncbi:hypothetical protein [Rhodococcus sp. A14]|uniref:AMP-binding enzyme n=1 Tax=Rhodococcus sp. A14 TaxID=1194106 RepID=UPI0032171F07
MTTFSRVDRCPEEVEDVLMMHPAIYDVVVISVDDLKRGQQFKAVVRVKPEVRECSDQLPISSTTPATELRTRRHLRGLTSSTTYHALRPESLIGVNSS